jgi:hypothetical protein
VYTVDHKATHCFSSSFTASVIFRRWNCRFFGRRAGAHRPLSVPVATPTPVVLALLHEDTKASGQFGMALREERLNQMRALGGAAGHHRRLRHQVGLRRLAADAVRRHDSFGDVCAATPGLGPEANLLARRGELRQHWVGRELVLRDGAAVAPDGKPQGGTPSRASLGEPLAAALGAARRIQAGDDAGHPLLARVSLGHIGGPRPAGVLSAEAVVAVSALALGHSSVQHRVKRVQMDDAGALLCDRKNVSRFIVES